MFVTDNLVYLELHKTGCSHIRRLLDLYLEGSFRDKHNRPTNEQIRGRFILGSIRNPWDWYVSLWAFGCAGKGAVRERTRKRLDFSYYHRRLPKEMGKNWLSPGELARTIWHDALKPTSVWQPCYGDAHSPVLFRQWLTLLLDPARKYDMGEGFALSPVSSHAGLMTYRFLRLFTAPAGKLYSDRRLASLPGCRAFWDDFGIVDGFVRTETLEDDLLRQLEASGNALNAEQVADLRSQSGSRTNTSSHGESAQYYDQATADLVSQREAFVIERFGYQPPLAGRSSAVEQAS